MKPFKGLKMKNLVSKAVIFIISIINTIPVFCGEGSPAVELNKKVRTDGLTGLNYFLANTYNNDRLLFALLSTGSVIVLGIIITYLIGLIIKPHKYYDKME